MTDIRPLLGQYDCLGWVPTIKGALSFALVDESSTIFGDVDKYAIDIKTYDGLNARHYLLASSLHTVNDRKHGKDYVRTFRYVFYGSIGRGNEKDDHLRGHLYILVEDTNVIPELENELLKRLKLISKKKDAYNIASQIDAQSMKDLSDYRKALVEEWQAVKDIMCSIENDEEQKRTIFSFDLLMTRDGLLLLKDVTRDNFRIYYADVDSEDDYTKHLPVHRVFKMAMNFVKYLFHTNYHHDFNHDTLLPASNLYPWRDLKDNEYPYELVRHQVESLLNPVTSLKRRRFKKHNINAEGILLYALSMVNVFEYNSLISHEDAERSKKFIEIQKDEVGLMLQTQKSIFQSVLTQNDWLVIFTGSIAIVTSILKIFSIFVKWPQLEPATCLDRLLLKKDIVITSVLFSLSILAFWIHNRIVLSKSFKVKSRWLRKLFMTNSNLEKKHFSKLYTFWIFMNDIALYLGNSWRQIIKLVFYVAVGAIIGALLANVWAR